MRKCREWISLHFLPLFQFPTSKCVTFCCKMLNTALLSQMSQKSQHTRYEEIILGRTCCEEAPQFVPACWTLKKHWQCLTLFRIGNILWNKWYRWYETSIVITPLSNLPVLNFEWKSSSYTLMSLYQDQELQWVWVIWKRGWLRC